MVSGSTKHQDEVRENEEEGAATPLEKHVMFFDGNCDGLVFPSDTFRGFRAMGYGVLISALIALVINIFFSIKTKSWKSRHPFHFPIEVKKIHRGKHGSDSNVYDKRGRFNPHKFEEIFIRFAHIYPNALTFPELLIFIRSNMDPHDYIGWAAAFGEWMLVYWLGRDAEGLLHKETVRAVYDGTLFYRMAYKKA